MKKYESESCHKKVVSKLIAMHEDYCCELYCISEVNGVIRNENVINCDDDNYTSSTTGYSN